jgi:hypothetical protein
VRRVRIPTITEYTEDGGSVLSIIFQFVFIEVGQAVFPLPPFGLSSLLYADLVAERSPDPVEHQD